MHSEDITIFKEQATLMDTYRFCDFDFSIRSDSERVLGVFRDIFRRFRTNGRGSGLSYYILTEGSPSGPSTLIVDDRVYTIEEPYDLIGYAYIRIINSALSKVVSHYLFHAASLSFGNKGSILSAASRGGKTTLTLELIKRGFNFLSDDITAISKSDYFLHPFPKGIGILPSTFKLCPEAELDSMGRLPMIGGGEKSLLDIGNLYPQRMGKPCQAKYLVFLGLKPETEGQTKKEEYLYVVMSRIDDNLLSDLKGIEGVKEVSIHPYRKYPVLRFLLNSKGPILSYVEEICNRHKVLIFDRSNGKEKKPDFSGVPRLEKIPRSAAAIELLGRMKGLSHAEMLKDGNGGTVTDLLMFFGKFLEGVECFYLTPGRLKERADRICELYIRGDA